MSSSTATVCPHYLKGSCRRGKACKFKHQAPKSTAQVCIYFLRGLCTFGDKCSRSHSKPAPKSEPPSASESQDPDNARDTPEELDVAESASGRGKGRAEDAGWGTSQEDAPKISIKSPCVFYSQGLNCGNGDECEFAHITSSSNESGKDLSDAKATSSPPRKKSEATICKHYVRGSCRAGDACRLKHIQPTDKSYSVAGSESSEGPADWDFDGPPKGMAGISASGGPEAEDQTVPFSDDNANDEGNMPPQDSDTNDPDDIYGDEYYDNSANRDTFNQGVDADEDNGEGNTTLKDDRNQNGSDNGQPPFSGYASPRFSKDNGRRGSWYGPGWGERPEANPSPASPFQPPSFEPPRLRPLAVPQPIQTATPSPLPSIQPHWSQFADPNANAQVAFCKPHAQGLCTQGAATCRFRHFLTPEEYTLLFHDPQPNLWTFEPPTVSAISPQQPINSFSAPNANVNQTTANSNETPDAPKQPGGSTFAQECNFYRLGTCRNAERCPYAHNVHPVASEPAARSDQSWGNSRDTRSNKFDAPCKFYVDKGFCNRGDGCKYRHDNSTDKVDDPTPGWGSENNDHNANNEADKTHAHDTSGWKTNDDDNGWGPNADGWDVPPAPEWESPTNPEVEWGAAATTDSSWGTSRRDDSSPPTSRPTRNNVCFQFAKEGTCRRGKYCKFSHDAEPENKPSGNEWPNEWPAADPSPNHRDSQEKERSIPEEPTLTSVEHNSNKDDEEYQGEDDDQNYPAESSPPEGEQWTASWGMDNTPEAPGSRDEQCEVFARGGICTLGNDCPHLHGAPSVRRASPATEENEEGGENEDDSTERPASPKDDDHDIDGGNDEVGQTWDANGHAEKSSPVMSDSDTEEEEEEEEDQLDPIVFNHPIVSRFWEQCTITYGENITPTTVTTLADTRKIILSNLPAEVTPDDISEIACQYGKVTQTISLEETVDSATIQVEFADPLQAFHAFKNLHGQSYASREMTAVLHGARTVPVKRSVGQKIYAKVSWPKPYRRAWSHYSTITKAKQQALDLNNIIIRGRAIKTSFVNPKKAQKTAFAVYLQNLDQETTQSELNAICTDSDLITVEAPVFSEDATDDVKDIFDGHMEQFDLLPATNGATSTAFVTFLNEAIAGEFVKKLQSRPLEFLGKEALVIRGVHYARYCIAKVQFEAVKTEIENLAEQAEGSSKCTIQYNDHPSGRVLVRINSAFDNGVQFAETNTELRSILQGIVAKSHSEGKDLWDNYFETSNCANVMENVQKQTGTVIKRDLRNHRVRIFGPKDGQTKAHALITKIVSKVQDRRCEIELPRHKLHPLVNEQFKILQNAIGASKVSLDVVNSKLVVLGTSDEISKAKETIALLDHEGPSSASGSRNTCQICHHNAVNPVLLSCHHAYCNTCLQFAIRVRRSAPFLCIAQHTSRDGEVTRCSAHVPYIILHDILSLEEDLVLRASFYAYVRSNPDELFFCPSLDCGAVHRVKDDRGVNVKCTLCISEVCTHCKTLAHIGTPCPVTV